MDLTPQLTLKSIFLLVVLGLQKGYERVSEKARIQKYIHRGFMGRTRGSKW